MATTASSPTPPGLLLSPSSEDYDDGSLPSISPTSSSWHSPLAGATPRKNVRKSPTYSPATFWKTPSKSRSTGGGGEDVLPQCGPATVEGRVTPDARLGLTMRRIRNGLISPFRSAAKVSSKGSTFDGSSGVSLASNGSFGPSNKGGRASGAGRRSAAAAACLLSAAALSAYTFSGGTFDALFGGGARDAASSAPFEFRPPPTVGSESAFASSLFRDAYGSRTSDGSLAVDDPLNPGSIFVVADLKDNASSDDAAGSKSDNILHDESMKEFALGLDSYLEGRTIYPSFETEVNSYYSFKVSNLEHVGRARYTTPDGRSALIEVKFSVPPGLVRDVDDDSGSEDENSQEDGEDVETAPRGKRARLQRYVSAIVRHVEEYGRTRSPSNVELTYAGLPLMALDLALSDQVAQSAAAFGPLEKVLPHGSVDSYTHLAERFGWGQIAPYRIVFKTRDADKTIFTDDAFRMMHRVMGELYGVDETVETNEEIAEDEEEARTMGIAAVNLDSIPQRIEDGHMAEHLAEVMDELYGSSAASDAHGNEEGHGLRNSPHHSHKIKPHTRTIYDGAAYLRNNPVPFPLFVGAELCAKKNGGSCPIELLQLFVDSASSSSSEDGRATYVTATLGVDPFSEEGIKWLEAARAKLSEIEERRDNVMEDYMVAIEGGASVEYDAAQALRDDESEEATNSGADAMVLSPTAVAWGAVALLVALAVALLMTAPASVPGARHASSLTSCRNRPVVNHYDKKM